MVISRLLFFFFCLHAVASSLRRRWPSYKRFFDFNHALLLSIPDLSIWYNRNNGNLVVCVFFVLVIPVMTIIMITVLAAIFQKKKIMTRMMMEMPNNNVFFVPGHNDRLYNFVKKLNCSSYSQIIAAWIAWWSQIRYLTTALLLLSFSLLSLCTGIGTYTIWNNKRIIRKA